MTNFEKFKKDIQQKVDKMTVDDAADWLIEHGCACDYCSYEDEYTCNDDCEFGVNAWFERKVKE